MLFEMDELLLLENLTYMVDTFPFIGILNFKGKYIKEVINSIDISKIEDDKDYASYMTGFDWKNLIMAIEKKPNLMNVYVEETHIDAAYGGGGGISAIFISDENNEAVVAFRGTASNEWADDFVGANQTDSLQQINSLEWYKKVYIEHHLDKYTVTVTGHSKGGNKAKYITILDDTPDRCISFDGQGFSDKFIEVYANRIVKRQRIIENHNVDYDYVNILLNDVGKKTYYYGYDYGRGGFAESHCPNTFFDFDSLGNYTIRVNPEGQRPEMQILDQFINSMIRSAISDKERNETNRLVGILVEKAFALGKDGCSTSDYVSFMCDMMGDPQYSDNVAYIIAYTIKYNQINPKFLKALKDIMSHFNMDDLVKVIDVVTGIISSKRLNSLINLSNFLVLHVNSLVTRKIQSIARKKFGVELTKEQVKGVLTIVSMTKHTLNTLKIDINGSDITLNDSDIFDEELKLPETLDIVVLCGGLSNERNISIKTGYQISEALKSKGHNVILLDAFMGFGDNEMEINNPFDSCSKYSMEKVNVSDEVADLWAVKKRRTDQSSTFFGPNVVKLCKCSDIVFIALQGDNGENGKVQAAFDLLGIDYTGCDYLSSALAMNKKVAKELLTTHGVFMPKGITIKKNEELEDPTSLDLKYPLIIKPCNGGAGIGISIAADFTSYLKAIQDAFRFENEVIVEEYIEGREFAVGVLNGEALPVIEVFQLNTRDVETGMNLKGEHIRRCPADIMPSMARRLKRAAVRSCELLGLNAYAQVDFIMTEDGTYYCLECDSLPELTPTSQFSLEAKATGMEFADLCERIIEISYLQRK